jgi:hypothetical protein
MEAKEERVNERQRRYTVRRVVLPACGTESFTVIGRERRPVGIVDVYLGAPAAGRGLMHKGVEISRSLAREVEPSKHE